MGLHHKNAGHEYIVEIVYNVVQAVAIKPGKGLFHMELAGQGAVRGVYEDRQRHEPKDHLKLSLSDKEKGQ